MLALQGRTPAQPRPKSHSDGAEASAPSALHKGSALTLCHHHVMPPGLPVDTCPNFQTNWWAEELCSRSPGLAFGGCSAINRCTSWASQLTAFLKPLGQQRRTLSPGQPKPGAPFAWLPPSCRAGGPSALPGLPPTLSAQLLCSCFPGLVSSPSLYFSSHHSRPLSTASILPARYSSCASPSTRRPGQLHPPGTAGTHRGPQGWSPPHASEHLPLGVSDLTSSPKVASLCWPISSSGPS